MLNINLILILNCYIIAILNIYRKIYSKNKYIIFGIISNLTYNQSKYFFLSLIKINYRGNVIMFTDRMCNIYYYNNLSIEYIYFDYTYPYYPIKNSKYSVKESFLNRTFPILTKITKHRTFIWILRYYLIFTFIYFYGSINDIYLMSDVKDVIFQKDPFKWNYKKGVYLVEESKIIKLKNLDWMKKYHTDDRILNNSIINGGIIFGSSTEIKLFLGEYLDGYKKEGKYGEDQAYLNLFYYSKKQFNYPVYICESEKCFARCLAQEIRFTIDILINETDYMIYNKDGSLPALIHQYTYALTKSPTNRKELFEIYRNVRSI